MAKKVDPDVMPRKERWSERKEGSKHPTAAEDRRKEVRNNVGRPQAPRDKRQ